MGLILFDIDGTLFDPEKFGQLIRSRFVKILNITEEELIRANADYYAKLESTADFNPREITAHLASAFAGDKEELDRVFWEDDKIYKEALFADAEDCLRRIAPGNILGIYSQGNYDLQVRKLAACGISKYFRSDYVFIHPRKLVDEALTTLPREAVLIDNHHDVAKACAPYLKTVWLNRKTEDTDSEIQTIHTLNEFEA